MGLIKTITLDRKNCERLIHRELKRVPDFKKYRIGPRMKDASTSVEDANAQPIVPQNTYLNAEVYDQDGKNGGEVKEGFI